ncbi:MAG TPA: PAS domain S-box protein [Gemmataceae bacterium]|nr:PAS domain S-box protein [Gemmataceae bacterium]
MQSLRVFLLLPEGEVYESVNAALREPEFERVWCRSASDALIVLSHRKFDLLISQAALPDMSGMDLVATLDAEGIDLPSILLMGPEDKSMPLVPGGQVCDVVPLSEDFAVSLADRVRNAVAKHQLEQANRIYIAALESARDGIMIADLQGVVLHVNRALEDLTGFSRDELVGRPSQILCASKQTSELCARIWMAVMQRASWQGELIDHRKDGTAIDVSLTVSPILDSRGRLTHCVAIERDITSRRAIESRLLQAQKIQSLGTLAGGVAHEFNNLLTGIMGYAGLALTQADDQHARKDFLKEIVGLAERAANLTRQMLAYARKSPMNRRPVSVTNLINQTMEFVGSTLHQAVVVEGIDGASSLRVEADASQIEQVLVNLILNAHDASAGEEPVNVAVREVAVSASKDGFPDNIAPGDYVHVEVRDRGQGMSAEVLSQALDPFFTTRPVGKGTGMGLSVAMGIVRNHFGFLTIDSEEGLGTSVGIYLPRLQEAHTKPVAADSFIEPEPVSPAHILVLDDESAVLDVVRRYLEDAGHHVLCARDATELLALACSSDAIDMAILDELPSAPNDGKLVERLLELRPSLLILFCPGLSLDTPEVRQMDNRRVLRKPFRMNELGFVVQELLTSAT